MMHIVSRHQDDTSATYHEISIANVMLDQAATKYDHSTVLSIDGLRVDPPQICSTISQLNYLLTT